MPHGFQSTPSSRYDGPDFDEFCIQKGAYLKASRNRHTCAQCALSALCQAGFDRQIELVVAGKDPSLTANSGLAASELTAPKLLSGLNEVQAAFVRKHIPGLREEIEP